MTPCKMIVEPGTGRGDCFRSCVAALLDVGPIAVPHFFEHGDALRGWADFEQWLFETHNLAWCEMTFPGSLTVGDLLDGLRYQLKDTYAMLLGYGFTENHAVVILNGEIVCDPSWTNMGINGPSTNGVYGVGLLIPARMKVGS
jgi:sulfur carrier protein ThiS